jgi:hypothetical protein
MEREAAKVIFLINRLRIKHPLRHLFDFSGGGETDELAGLIV